EPALGRPHATGHCVVPAGHRPRPDLRACLCRHGLRLSRAGDDRRRGSAHQLPIGQGRGAAGAGDRSEPGGGLRIARLHPVLVRLGLGGRGGIAQARDRAQPQFGGSAPGLCALARRYRARGRIGDASAASHRPGSLVATDQSPRVGLHRCGRTTGGSATGRGQSARAGPRLLDRHAHAQRDMDGARRSPACVRRDATGAGCLRRLQRGHGRHGNRLPSRRRSPCGRARAARDGGTQAHGLLPGDRPGRDAQCTGGYAGCPRLARNRLPGARCQHVVPPGGLGQPALAAAIPRTAGAHELCRRPRAARCAGHAGERHRRSALKWWLPLLAGALPAQAAWSQDATPQEATTLGTVVVTARMRPEKLQDVPMSVQTLSGDLLDELNLSSMFDLQFNIPGLVVNTTGVFGADFSLRGIANQGGSNLAVASHVNGVYQGGSGLAIMRTFDMERVEVLKGPQGTLYGRNATGGSMNFITRAPADTFGAEVEAAYGTYSTARAQGNLNVPFRNGAARVAFIASEGDGYIRNSVDERRFGENDFAGARLSLGADFGNAAHIEVMLQRVEDNGATAELWTPSPVYFADPSDIRLTTATLADPSLKLKDDNANITLEVPLGSATLRAITGYASGKVRDRDDCSGLPFLQ